MALQIPEPARSISTACRVFPLPVSPCKAIRPRGRYRCTLAASQRAVTPPGGSILSQVTFTIRVNPIPAGTVKIGQVVDAVGVSGGRLGIVGIYNTPDYTDIVVDSNTGSINPPGGSGFNNTTAGLTGLSFEATSPDPSKQVIGNSKSNSNAILTVTGSSTFGGQVVNAVSKFTFPGNSGTAVSPTNATTGLTFNPSASGSTLILNGNNTYTGTTTVLGTNSSMLLNYIGTASSANMVLSGANAALTLNNPNNLNYTGVISGATGNFTKGSGGTMTLSKANTYGGATTVSGGSCCWTIAPPAHRPATSSTIPEPFVAHPERRGVALKGSATAANSQQFSGLTLGAGGSSIVLTSNATQQPLSVNVGAITRNGGILLVTNPSGTISATNGVQTTTGSAGPC